MQNISSYSFDMLAKNPLDPLDDNHAHLPIFVTLSFEGFEDEELTFCVFGLNLDQFRRIVLVNYSV